MRVRAGVSGVSRRKFDEVGDFLGARSDAQAEIARRSRELQEMAKRLPTGTGAEAEAARQQYMQRMQQLTQDSQRAATEAAAKAEDPYAAAGLPPLDQDPGIFGLPWANEEEQLFVVRFDAEDLLPGDRVSGVVWADRPQRARGVRVELCYVDCSPDYMEGVSRAETGTIHEGDLEVGVQIPFSLQLPQDALPPYTRAVRDAAMIDRGEPAGYLTWALVVVVDVPLGGDLDELHPVPVAAASAWPDIGGLAREPLQGADGSLDLELRPETRAVARGDELAVRLDMDDPAGRRNLQLGLVCECAFDTQEGDSDTGYHRRTRRAPAFERWQDLDSGRAEQTVRMRVPEDAPFSYRHEGGAFGFEWKLVAREQRRLRRDRSRELSLAVRP